MASELPQFLSGSCTCAHQGGCVRSDKGPWNDPNIVKQMIRSGEALYSRKIVTVSNGERCVISYDKPSYVVMKGGDASTADSGSDIKEIGSPRSRINYSLPALDPTTEEAKLAQRSMVKMCQWLTRLWIWLTSDVKTIPFLISC